MRNTTLKIFSLAALALTLGASQLQAACRDVHLSSKLGVFNGELCLTATAEGTQVTLTGEAFATRTGTTYTVDAQANITGTPGNYAVEGTVTLNDGETTTTIPFSFACSNPISGASTFSSGAIDYAFAYERLERPAPLAIELLVD